MHNKRAKLTNQLLRRSAESELSILRRPAASYLDVVNEGAAKNLQHKGRFEALTSLVSMILIISGPTILVCAASKSIETLCVMLVLYLAGAAAGGAIFGFRGGEFRSHILLAPENNPDDVQMPKAA